MKKKIQFLNLTPALLFFSKDCKELNGRHSLLYKYNAGRRERTTQLKTFKNFFSLEAAGQVGAREMMRATDLRLKLLFSRFSGAGSPGVPSGGESRGVLGEEEDSQAGDDQPPHCSLSDCGLEVVWRDWRVPLSSCPPTSSSATHPLPTTCPRGQ